MTKCGQNSIACEVGCCHSCADRQFMHDYEQRQREEWSERFAAARAKRLRNERAAKQRRKAPK